MREIFNRKLDFYLTSPGPCPYLPDREERKVFTPLMGQDAAELNESLTHAGFRRSQNIAYRPACATCASCLSARVVVDAFEDTKRWRKIRRLNEDLVRIPRPAIAVREHFRLLSKYLDARHPSGGMAGMSIRDFTSMIEETRINSVLFEYRLRPAPGEEPDSGALIGVALSDVLRDGLSMVYSFFDVDHSRRSMGSYMILDHIANARHLGIRYVYLGYWVPGSPKMDYKASYQPLEILQSDTWRPMRKSDRTQSGDDQWTDAS
jgi:arginine-tRNA-protein transferase